MPSIEKVSARVFCQLRSRGGNPVSVFYGSELDHHQRSVLSKACEWESVFLSSSKLYFYMPTGEQVSFCAHAAMGSAFVGFQAGRNSSRFSFETAPCGDSIGASYEAEVHDGDVVSMTISTTWTESPISNVPLLHRILREFHGIKAASGQNVPAFVNSSIARPKSLVYVRDVNDVKAPTMHDSYRQACDAIDSTGLYFYSGRSDEVGAWDCRQFPRASGYPEDPATGIAAAALAMSLHDRQPRDNKRFKFYQGFAMGKPSIIVVDNIDLDYLSFDRYGQAETSKERKVSFDLLGRVEIDGRQTIKLDEGCD